MQAWPDGDWMVRQVPGAAATKTYRCPGCDQEILPGVAHVVVWPERAQERNCAGTGTIRAGGGGRAALGLVRGTDDRDSCGGS